MGRVGLLALTLGLGAVVAGSAGIANAEGPVGNNAGGPAAQSSDSPTGSGTVKGPPSIGSSGAKTRKLGLSPVPRIKPANSRRAPIGDHQGADGGLVSIPGVSVRIPQKNPAPLGSGAPIRATGTSASPPSVRPNATRIRPRLAATPTADPTPTGSPATDPSVDSPSATDAAPITTATFATAARDEPAIATSVATVVSGVLSALAATPSAANTGGAPAVPMPMPMVQAMLQLVHREIERTALGANHFGPAAGSTPIGVNAVPAIAPGVPTPADQVPTVYGDIGKWMLQSNGQISDYGGLPYGGRTVLEPVNVIIVDPTSTSAAEAACKLNTVMFWSGYPAQPIHSTGFQGTIDDVTYAQQPTGPLLGFSDNFFLFPNNHGRIFGPDPVETSTGYVWSGSFSTEQFVIYDLLPRHAYVSSNLARNALAMRLIASGQATYGGMVPMDNSYNTVTTTTGDHDGYAVVIILK
ncbi:hypothetical protein [Mycobacterium sp. NPDC050441]|uniref:hypothetical protein n=1 Tax=Mycobacterium sp. NPDC050441 TaxID=3155403 RepID=UPI0033FB58DA